MEQIIIGITGAIAILLSQQKRFPNLIKYASIIGLLGQPFWFYVSYKEEMWGIFFLSFLYTYAWIIGLINNWKPVTNTKGFSFNIFKYYKYIANPKFGISYVYRKDNKLEVVLFKNCYFDKRLSPSMYNRKVYMKFKGGLDYKPKWVVDAWAHSIDYLKPIMTFKQLIKFVRLTKSSKYPDSEYNHYSIIIDKSEFEKIINSIRS